jgi:flavin reductase (DIM6/NTAB) family NADH-FMN oxidoreductase RutF
METFEASAASHVRSEPAILYFGTPVVLLSTINPDGTANLAPISSIFWLGWRAILGISTNGQTVPNLRRTAEIVLNLPSAQMVDNVDRLALTTGTQDVPEAKRDRGYHFLAGKFQRAGLTPLASETVTPPRVAECPVVMEAVVEAVHDVAEDDAVQAGQLVTVEVRVQRVLVHPNVLVEGKPNRIDPDTWRPLIMLFSHFYGLTDSQLRPSTLAGIDESLYRGPDIDRGRTNDLTPAHEPAVQSAHEFSAAMAQTCMT